MTYPLMGDPYVTKAAPSPEEAPVTRAVRPSSLNISKFDFMNASSIFSMLFNTTVNGVVFYIKHILARSRLTASHFLGRPQDSLCTVYNHSGIEFLVAWT